MRVEVYDADSRQLLDEASSEDTSLPKPDESWPVADGVKTVVEAVYVVNPAKGEMFIAVKVR